MHFIIKKSASFSLLNKSEIYSSASAKYLLVSDCQYKIPHKIYLLRNEGFQNSVIFVFQFKISNITFGNSKIKFFEQIFLASLWPLIHIQRNPLLPIMLVLLPTNHSLMNDMYYAYFFPKKIYNILFTLIYVF